VWTTTFSDITSAPSERFHTITKRLTMSRVTPRALGSLALWVIHDEHRTIRQEISAGFGDGPLPIKQRGGEDEEPAKQ